MWQLPSLCSLLPILHGFGRINDDRPDGYSHDAGPVAHNPCWMKDLPSVRLSELSIPGTHDTLGLRGGDFARTQAASLRDQLLSGVRAIDVRCRHVGNKCSVYHGVVDEHSDLDAVLGTLAAFLADHPSETVLMRLGSGGAPAPQRNNRSWASTWRSYRDRYNAMRPSGQGPLFWPHFPGQATRPLQLDDVNPLLDEVRGRVVVLQDFDDDDHRPKGHLGIPYPGAFRVQDRWEMGSRLDLYGKWLAVKDTLEEAARSAGNRWYMNYLSASVGGEPYFFASGQEGPRTGSPRLATGRLGPAEGGPWPDFPRAGCSAGMCSIMFEGTNILAARHIAAGRGRVGVVMADFPGPALIDAIIARNSGAVV